MPEGMANMTDARHQHQPSLSETALFFHSCPKGGIDGEAPSVVVSIANRDEAMDENEIIKSGETKK